MSAERDGRAETVERGRGAPDLRRYVELFDLAPYPYLVTDAFGAIKEANRATAEMLGVSARFLRRRPLASFVLAQERRSFRSAVTRIPDALGPVRFDVTIEGRNRDRFEVEASAMAVREARGTTIRWALVDVTARNEAERDARWLAIELEQRVEDRTADLLRQRAQLEAIIEHFPAAVMIVEAASSTLTVVNAQAVELAGGSVEVGSKLDLTNPAVFRPDGSQYAPHELPIARALCGESIWNEVGTVVDESGVSATLLMSSSPILDAAGNVSAAVMTFQNITDRDRRERAERDFVTNAAHELRTPLAAIASAVEVLQAGAKEIPEERDRFLDHIEGATNRLGRLGRALLLLARAQTGQEQPKLDVVDLDPLLRTVAAELEPSHGVDVHVDCEPGIATLANSELLEQALSNVARNAAAYTAAGSIRLAGRANGDAVCIEVADTGAGLPPDVRERMFDRFYRGGDRTTDGFGLGLNIAAESIRAIGGTLEIRDAEEAGTRVVIQLPLARMVVRT